MASVLENMKKTQEAVVDGYNSEWNIEAILRPRSDDCTHQVSPRSIGREARTNEEYRAYFESIRQIFRNFKVCNPSPTQDTCQRLYHVGKLTRPQLTVETPIFDSDARRCALKATCTADMPIGPYDNEYVILLAFSEGGDEVTKVEKFVDSAYSKEFFGRLREYQEKS